MINVTPDINPSARYNITKSALILGITRATLRNWEHQGKIRYSMTKEGVKYLTGAQLKKIWDKCWH